MDPTRIEGRRRALPPGDVARPAITGGWRPYWTAKRPWRMLRWWCADSDAGEPNVAVSVSKALPSRSTHGDDRHGHVPGVRTL